MKFRQVFLVAVVCSATTGAMAQSSSRNTRRTVSPSTRTSQTKMAGRAKVGMDGYCPVCIIDAKKWEKGSPKIRSVYDGKTYLFPTAAIKKKFDASPAKYVPVLGGDCIVCFAKAKKRVPGNVRFAAIRNKRLYLFPSAKEKQMFQKAGNEFDKTDLAANGECSVCLVMARKHVKGSEKFVEIHNGMRYLFPSEREQKAFQRSPKKFAQAVKS